MRSRPWLVPVLALALASCSSGAPREELRDDVASVTDAANAGDPAGLRSAVEELLSTVRAQVASGDLPREEGQRISVLAQRLAQHADLLAPAPSPVPTQEPEPSPTPEPEPTEEPEPSPTPEPEPTEEPEPEPTLGEPDPGPTLDVDPLPQESPTPAQQSQGLQPSGEPTPTT